MSDSRDAYDLGYQHGESSVLADVSTLCDQLGIDVGDRHEFEAIRLAFASLKAERDRYREYVVDMAEGWVGDAQARAEMVLRRG